MLIKNGITSSGSLSFGANAGTVGINFNNNTSGVGTEALLNDYETGTWTPAFELSSGSLTYSSQIGNYTKVGRLVTIVFFIQVATSTSGVSTGNIITLPFSGANTNYSGISISVNGPTGLFSSYSNMQGLIASAATSIQLRGTSTANSAPGLSIVGQTITANTLIAGSATYYASF